MEKEKEREVVEAVMVLPTELSFKRIQAYEKYPKGQSRNRNWKHLKQILQAEREHYQNHRSDEPTCISIDSPLSLLPPKKICDITGFETPYSDSRTKLNYANTEEFKQVRSLPIECVQRCLALRNARVVLK